jgi:hypothetical protein
VIKALLLGAAAALLCGLAGLGGGVWLGMEWQRGKQAVADVVVLRSDVEALAQAAVQLRQAGVDIAQDFRTAHRKQEAIANDLDAKRDETRTFFERQRSAWQTFAAAHPELGACSVGPDGVQHWNTAARGARAAAAAAEDRGRERARAVPVDPAGAEPGNGAGDAGAVGSGSGAIPRLRGQQDSADPGSEGVRGVGDDGLLQGGGSAGHHGAGLRAMTGERRDG